MSIDRASIDAALDGYVPRHLDLYDWLAVRDWCLQVVRTYQPASVDDARRLIGDLSWFAAWAHRAAGHDLEVASILVPGLIGEYIDQHCDRLSPKVRAMARARLRRLAKAANRDFPPDLPGETAYTSAWRPDPYSPSELAAINDWLHGQRTATRRHKASILCALALGAGLYSHEAVRLRVRDITTDQDGTQVHVRGTTPRIVPVARDWEQPLQQLAASTDAGCYAIIPGRTGTNPSIVSAILAKANDDCGQVPTMSRMRATWITGLITRQVPYPAILQAAGLKNLRAYEQWLAATPQLDEQQYRCLLRG